MKKLFALIFTLILFTQAAIAQQIPCVDTLAAAQYGNELSHIPVNYGIRGFARKEFGDFYPVARQELQRGRPWVGVNLLWSDTHTYGDKDLKFVTSEAKRYQPLCKQYPGKIELATFTEHNLKNPDKYHDAVKKAAPDCGVVNSIWKGAPSKKYKNEVHGTHKKIAGVYNYSYDGTNSTDSNVVADLKEHQNASVFCMWHPRLNLRYGPKDTADRAQRVKEARYRSPNADMLKSLVYLFSNPGTIQVPKNWLVKTHAEKHDATDIKGDKLLIISPVKASAIELKRNGKQVAKLPYYGTYQGGGYRYYWNKYGYTAGSDLDIVIGNKKYGVANGGFRAPIFR